MGTKRENSPGSGLHSVDDRASAPGQALAWPGHRVTTRTTHEMSPSKLARTMHTRGSMVLARSDERRRGDPVLWTGLASCAGALATVAPLPVVLGSVVVGALLARAGARWLLVLSILSLFAGFGRAHVAVADYERDRDAVLSAGTWPSLCTVAGNITRSPALVGGGLRVVIDASDVQCPRASTKRALVAVHVPLDIAAARELARGDAVSVLASLAPPYRFWNDSVGDPRPTSARRGVLLSGGAEDVVVVREGGGVAWAIDRTRARLRDRILASFPLDTSAMARALVLGEDDLPEQDQRAFRRSGLAHLLAVSGMHLVLVVMGFVAAVRALLVRTPMLGASMDVMRIASGLGLPVAWIYAELAGGSGSAIRAAWMCSVVLSARLLGRRSVAYRALGLSLAAMSLVDPLVVFEVSFVLSALATGGILVMARPFETWVARKVPLAPAFVVRPFATTLAATVACAPVLAMMAPELPIGGLVANVVAVPLGEAAALPLCLVHALFAEWPAAESGAAAAASGALMLVRWVARLFTWVALPVPSPNAAELGTLSVVAAGVTLGRARIAWLGVGTLILALFEISTRARGAPHEELRVTFLDVGQGDSALIDLPDGSAMLIDGGGLVGSPIDVGERAVAELLSARRRTSLAVVVLSHPHPDHFLGLSSALARARPQAFWDTGQGEAENPTGRYADLLSDLRARKVPILHPDELCGARTVGGAVVEILAPCPSALPDRGANDNSFVLRVRFGDRAILFVGDAEHAEEQELIARLGAIGGLRADVLKVGHHGSRTSSSPAFLAAVSPSVAVVSSGVRNRFGHPHAPTLESLAFAGARILRTDRHGSIVVRTDGRSLDVRSMREEP